MILIFFKFLLFVDLIFIFFKLFLFILHSILLTKRIFFKLITKILGLGIKNHWFLMNMNRKFLLLHFMELFHPRIIFFKVHLQSCWTSFFICFHTPFIGRRVSCTHRLSFFSKIIFVLMSFPVSFIIYVVLRSYTILLMKAWRIVYIILMILLHLLIFYCFLFYYEIITIVFWSVFF